MAKRIVIMAGGTGGHVFPALAVAHMMLEQGWQVSWMGTRQGMESRVVPEHNIAIDWLSVAGLRGKGILSKVQAPLMLVRACMQAYKILRLRQPDVVLGMGGFVAGPGGLMARLLSIPLVIHEQNRIPGTTNRLLARFANGVLEAFPGSFKTQRHAVCTGNPLRTELTRLDVKRHREAERQIHLLVVGGSQGARALNEIVPPAAAKTASITVKHQTGLAMLETVREKYRSLGVKAEVVAFIDDMAAAYQWADMVVCRSGAMTVSELAAAGLPAILIPFPYAIDDHQTANARYLTDAGGGIVIDQRDVTAGLLAEKIQFVIEHLAEMGAASRSCARLDATAKVVEVCLKGAEK